MKPNYYSVEKQETVLIYETESKQWDIYTTVPKHINRLQSYMKKNAAITTKIQQENDSKGNCIALRMKTEKLPNSYTFNR